MTAGELHDKLSLLGADVLSKTIRALLDDSLKPIKQNDDESCYSPMLTKALCPIDFTKTIDEVHNKIEVSRRGPPQPPFWAARRSSFILPKKPSLKAAHREKLPYLTAKCCRLQGR